MQLHDPYFQHSVTVPQPHMQSVVPCFPAVTTYLSSKKGRIGGGKKGRDGGRKREDGTPILSSWPMLPPLCVLSDLHSSIHALPDLCSAYDFLTLSYPSIAYLIYNLLAHHYVLAHLLHTATPSMTPHICLPQSTQHFSHSPQTLPNPPWPAAILSNPPCPTTPYMTHAVPTMCVHTSS